MMRFPKRLGGLGAVVLFGGMAAACGNGVPAASGSGGGAAASCGSAGASLGAPAVTIGAQPGGTSYVWSPTSASAHVGQVIGWTNPSDGTLHNIGVDGCPDFGNSAFAPGGTWQVKFKTAGSYAFHCTIHPGMDGKLTIS